MAGSAIGVTMIVRSMVAADGTAEVVLTSGGGVSLLPAHLLALSGVVVLLSLARVLRRSRLTERRRVAVIALAVVGHVVLTAVVAATAALAVLAARIVDDYRLLVGVASVEDLGEQVS